MSNPLECPTRVCSGHVDRVEEWRENDYCSFAEAECDKCPFLYWIVKRDNKLTIRYRDDDPGTDPFDQRSSEIR